MSLILSVNGFFAQSFNYFNHQKFKVQMKKLVGSYTIEEFNVGDVVKYVPRHAYGDETHSDCETGVVSSKNNRFVFVKYYRADGTLKTTAQGTDATDLVILQNSGGELSEENVEELAVDKSENQPKIPKDEDLFGWFL